MLWFYVINCLTASFLQSVRLLVVSLQNGSKLLDIPIQIISTVVFINHMFFILFGDVLIQAGKTLSFGLHLRHHLLSLLINNVRLIMDSAHLRGLWLSVIGVLVE